MSDWTVTVGCLFNGTIGVDDGGSAWDGARLIRGTVQRVGS